MEVEQVIDVSHLQSAPKSQIVAKWLSKLDEGKLTHVHFRDHWRIWVPRAFTPEENLSCLDWNIKEEIGM